MEKKTDPLSLGKMTKALIWNQMIGLIWGIVLMLVFSTIFTNNWGLVFVSLVGLFILCTSVYSTGFDFGFRDRNANKMRNVPIDRLKGLKAGLLASIPNLVITLAYLVCHLFLKAGEMITGVIYRVYFVNYIFFLQGTVEGTAYIQFPMAVVAPLILLVVPAFAYFGYTMGLKDIRISERLVYKNGKKEGKREQMLRR